MIGEINLFVVVEDWFNKDVDVGRFYNFWYIWSVDCILVGVYEMWMCFLEVVFFWWYDGYSIFICSC